MARRKVFLLTYVPSPYQVELLDALGHADGIELAVAYLNRSSGDRLWPEPKIKHAHVFPNDTATAFAQTREILRQSNVAIFNYYQDRFARRLLSFRQQQGDPWVFWGERTGYRMRTGLLSVASRLYRTRTLRTLHNSDAPIWGIGRWAVERYRAEFGGQRHYADIPYFSNLRRFHSDRPARDDKTVFLFSGSLTKRKGVDLLAHAFLDVSRSHPRAELIVLGDGEYMSRMEATLRPVHDRVRFLGFKEWDHLPSVYRSADFLCAPSRYDGWAMVVPEALAAGLPVISTNRTGAALEFVRDGQNGWLIPADDAEALADSMRRAADLSLEQRQLFSANARETVSTHQLNNGVEKIRQELEWTCENWSPPGG